MQIFEELFKIKPTPGASFTGPRPDRKILCRCSLVHSSWTGVAQFLLFQSVVIDRSFIDTFLHPKSLTDKSPLGTHRSGLLQHIRELYIAVAPLWGGGVETLDELGKVLTALLQQFRGLRDVTINAGRSTQGLSTTKLRALKHCIAEYQPPIRSLRFVNAHPGGPLVGQFLNLLPTLQHVHIGNHDLGPPSGVGMCQARLSRLTLSGHVQQDFLSWLLKSSHSSLEVLDLPDLFKSKLIPTLHPCLGKIKYLSLRYAASALTEILSACSSLEELVIHHITLERASPGARRLPPTLKHLSVVGPFDSLELYINLVKDHKRLRSLRMWGCGQGVNLDPMLVSACHASKVELVLRGDASWPAITWESSS